MGLFFKSKRDNKNSSDNNITVNQADGTSNQTMLNLMYNFLKDMRAEIKADMKEINEQVRRTGKRIDLVEAEVNELKIRITKKKKMFANHEKQEGNK